MGFGNLTAAWWALLIVPIILLYFLRVRPRRQPVATMMFWDQVFEQRPPRAAWRRLRHLLSLLMQLLLLALLVSSLVEPKFSWESSRGRRIILVVDHSASMNATDARPSRLERARAEGRRLVRGLRQNDEMAIIAASGIPRVQCGLTGHQPSLNRALSDIRPTDGLSQIGPAVRLARDLLNQHPRGRLVVISDGCVEVGDSPPDADDVQWRLVGGPCDNVGITRFQTRRSATDPLGYEALVEVWNFGREPIAARLELRLDDQLIDVLPLRLKPRESWTHLIKQTSLAGGRLRARLHSTDGTTGWSDALAADDQSVALLPRRPRQPVILVTEGNRFLQRAFEANPMVDVTVTDSFPDNVSADTIVVYDRRTPQRIPMGRVLVVAPESSSDVWQAGPLLQDPVVARQEADSPLMTHVRLDGENELLPEARQLRFEGQHQVLAATITDDPIYVAVRNSGRKLLVCSINLAKGDLPLRTAFPIMVANALNWFQDDRGELREAVAAGDTVELKLDGLIDQWRRGLPDGNTGPDAADGSPPRLLLRSPAGVTRTLLADSERITVGPLDECGIWSIESSVAASAVSKDLDTGHAASERSRVEPAGNEGATQDGATPRTGQVRPLMQLACNLASERESDLRPVEISATPLAADALAAGGRPAWYYLALSALILFPLEWFLYQRRWIS